ncbi:hypothetical protein K0C01_09450 [Salinarchaeum sp. IM2453]|uniref:hypothetical protein n=1 Tax=Salinarchaeum sp. IM2453 TaxID=2862870 RepID=UPI001C82C585|nr:hypothetical protein [Salinarchaeum sp. IM2453]QZA88017.1 hypothetical protein K0C01_09450 [Salinarchaeum sp. IM2453]
MYRFSDPFRILGIITAVLLIGCLFYLGSLAYPYIFSGGADYHHSVSPETDEHYEDIVHEHNDTIEVHQYEELSPAAQEVFNRAKVDGSFTPDICQNYTIICDGYYKDELPDDFTYGEGLSIDEAYDIIEQDDNRYLLLTGDRYHATGPAIDRAVPQIVLWLTVVPLVLFIGAVTFRAENEQLIQVAVSVGLGSMIVIIAAPYITMIGAISTFNLSLLFLAAVWTSIVTLLVKKPKAIM